MAEKPEDKKKKLLKKANIKKPKEVLGKSQADVTPNDFSTVTEQRDVRGRTREQALEQSRATTTEIVRDTNTGRQTGVRLPDGRSLLNLNPREVQALATKLGGTGIGGGGVVDAEQAAIQRQKKQEGQAFAAELETFEQPEEVQLNPAEDAGQLPAIGSSIAVLRDLFGDVASFKGLEIISGKGVPVTSEDVIQATKRELERKAIQEQLTLDEKLGATLEALGGGFLPSAIQQFIGTPGEIARQMEQRLEEQQQSASDWASRAEQGKVSPRVAVNNIQRIKNNMDDMKGRMALMISASATLRANPDIVDGIEDKILVVEEELKEAFDTARLGAISPTTEVQMFEELDTFDKQND